MRFVCAAIGAAMALGGLSLAACNEPVYLEGKRPLETLNSVMTSDATALFSDSDLFVLPVRKPTQKERDALAAEQKKLGLPMPVPWAGERDFDIEIEYTIKNLDSQPIGTMLAVNGGNEFGDYVKALYTDPDADAEEQPTPPELMGSDQLVPMDANAEISGVLREDQLREAGLDLEVIVRYPPPNAGMNAPFLAIENNSTATSIGLEGIPKGDITPAMVRFAFLLQSTGHASLDYVVRVREKGTPGNKLAPGGKNLYVSTAASLPPVVMPTPNPVTD